MTTSDKLEGKGGESRIRTAAGSAPEKYAIRHAAMFSRYY
jgi:hypothetical protein